MTPSTTANATAKRRTSAQDPAPARGRGNKVAKHAHAGDAPTSVAAEGACRSFYFLSSLRL